MAAKHIKPEREERSSFDIYQLDPSFYKKIISRSCSMRFGHQNSLKTCCGKVPFIWEIQPGKPRDVSNDETVQPIRFPPAVYSLTMPRPSFPPTGPKACLFKTLNKAKKVKNMQIGQMPKPNFVMKNAKVYFSKKMKKVEKIKKIFLGNKIKSKYAEKASGSDGFEFSYFDFDDLTLSPPSASSPPIFSFKSQKL